MSFTKDMHIHLTPRHLKLTAAIHAYVAEKFSHLEHSGDHILGAHVVLWHDETRKPSQAFCVKAHIAIPGPDIYAEVAAADLYAAIDLMHDKLAQLMRKHKTKIVEHKKHVARKAREKAKTLGVGV